MDALNASLSPFWSHSNPVDVLGDATAGTYQKTLDICIKDENIDGVVVVLTPQAMTDPVAVAKSIVEHGPYNKPVLASWMGQSEVQAGVKILELGKIPNFETPERAVQAFGYIMRHPAMAEKLREIPKYLDVEVDYEGAKKLIEEVVADGRTTFTEYEGKMMFSKYGIPIKGMARATTEDEAAAEANKIGLPVVMKILSPDIMHKTDVGGVKVKLTTEEEVRKAYNDIMTSVKAKKPEARIHGVLIRPGEVFSYWRLIGKPSRIKGYVEGMVLRNGTFHPGTGGGLCQLSNMIFWMAAHSPLTVVERHRHGYDVFPDSNRTQPFGSGATCYYPHGDLMLRNDTQNTYQILVTVGNDYLEGSLRVSAPMTEKYCIKEKNHHMEPEYWGGYSRHNELFQDVYSLDGQLLESKRLVENHALMMYSPFLDASPTSYPDEQ
jgi:hypothetical protein